MCGAIDRRRRRRRFDWLGHWGASGSIRLRFAAAFGGGAIVMGVKLIFV